MKPELEKACKQVLDNLHKMWWKNATEAERKKKVRRDCESKPLFGDDNAKV